MTKGKVVQTHDWRGHVGLGFILCWKCGNRKTRWGGGVCGGVVKLRRGKRGK